MSRNKSGQISTIIIAIVLINLVLSLSHFGTFKKTDEIVAIEDIQALQEQDIPIRKYIDECIKSAAYSAI